MKIASAIITLLLAGSTLQAADFTDAVFSVNAFGGFGAIDGSAISKENEIPVTTADGVQENSYLGFDYGAFADLTPISNRLGRRWNLNVALRGQYSNRYVSQMLYTAGTNESSGAETYAHYQNISAGPVVTWAFGKEKTDDAGNPYFRSYFSLSAFVLGGRIFDGTLTSLAAASQTGSYTSVTSSFTGYTITMGGGAAAHVKAFDFGLNISLNEHLITTDRTVYDTRKLDITDISYDFYVGVHF